MYEKYFETYTPTVVIPSLRLPKTSPILESELNGQFLSWASEHLYSKKFPAQLISALLIQLQKEFQGIELSESRITEAEKLACLAGGDGDDEDDGSAWYNPHKLKQLVLGKVDELCIRYRLSYSSQELELESGQRIHDISYAAIRNRRRTLEDRFVALPFLDLVFQLPTPASYYAVFDGHNGSDAASFAAAQLHLNLIGLNSFPGKMEKALKEAFVTTDDEFVTKCYKMGSQSGTTVVVAVLIQSRIYVAWVGDSLAILAATNKPPQSLVEPHKPTNDDERARIARIGGHVINGRVNGILAVSRAIGDAELKHCVSPTPDVLQIELDGTEEFLVLATDGLWDVVTPDECAELVKDFLLETGTSEGLSKMLAEEAEKLGSADNTTVLVVFLQPVPELIIKYDEESAKEVEVATAIDDESGQPGVVTT